MRLNLRPRRAVKTRQNAPFPPLPGKSQPPSTPLKRCGSALPLTLVLAVPLAAMGATFAWNFTGWLPSRHRHTDLATETVKRGMLEIKLTERGAVDSANNLEAFPRRHLLDDARPDRAQTEVKNFDRACSCRHEHAPEEMYESDPRLYPWPQQRSLESRAIA